MNSKFLGFIIGLILPMIGILVFWGGAYGPIGLRGIGILLTEMEKLSAVISIGLLANLPGFFLFYWKKKDVSARGVIMATFVYAFIIITVKFIL